MRCVAAFRVEGDGPERRYEWRVKHFIDEFKTDPDLQIFDLPFAAGLTLVRKCR
jgi:hypothetical protein